MKKRPLALAAGGAAGLLLLLCACFWFITGTQSFMTGMGRLAAEKGSELLGTRVEVGEVCVDSPWTVTVRDVALSATVRISLFGMIAKKPAEAVEDVLVRRPEAWIVKRGDGSWNFRDLMEEESEPSGFRGVVRSEFGAAALAMDGKSLRVSEVNGSVDFADAEAMGVALKARSDAAAVSLSGKVGEENASLEIEGADIDLAHICRGCRKTCCRSR